MRRSRILGYVRKRLAADEVGRRLNRGRKPARVDADLNRHRRAVGQLGERGRKSSAFQAGGTDPACEATQLRTRSLELLLYPSKQFLRGGAARARGERRALVGARAEPLLSALVQLTCEASALGVGCLDDP